MFQACDITGGLYLKIPQKVALAQYLLVSVSAICCGLQWLQFEGRVSMCVFWEQWVFLPDSEQRSQLVLPQPAHVDYRAACFCHRNLIEIGYVCSVCLSSEQRMPSSAFQRHNIIFVVMIFLLFGSKYSATSALFAQHASKSVTLTLPYCQVKYVCLLYSLLGSNG